MLGGGGRVTRHLVRQLPSVGGLISANCTNWAQQISSDFCPVESHCREGWGGEMGIASSIKCRCSWQHFNALKPGSVIHIKRGFAPPPSKYPDLLQTIWQKGSPMMRRATHVAPNQMLGSRCGLVQNTPERRNVASKGDRFGKENQGPLLVGLHWK